MLYNSRSPDSLDAVYGLALGASSLVLGALTRLLSIRVLRVDAERTIFSRRRYDDSHVIIGEFQILSILGAPHVLRTRSPLGFSTLVFVVIATTALSLASLAFSTSHQLRTGDHSVKATARPGSHVEISEDIILSYADWFRSSGAVSFCQRRNGAQRTYYQPFVELASTTKVYCGEKLPVNVSHESEESIETVRPSTLRIESLPGVLSSTPFSNFVIHDLHISGKGLLAVCNTGEFYRGIRSGRVSQSCAFTTKTSLILGGYHTNQSTLSGPGQTPVAEDIQYYDSYEVTLGTELNKYSLMQALTMWDIGALSEVEVAVLAALQLETVENVPSFIGGFERLHVDGRLLIGGLSVAVAILLWMIFVLLWDGFSRDGNERLRNNVATLEFISHMMRSEALNGRAKDSKDVHLNHIAIRDLARCSCKLESGHDEDCTIKPIFHIGTASLGRATVASHRDIVKGLQNTTD